jgi:uncharacterized membrane protein YhaH (DUF805 family)
VDFGQAIKSGFSNYVNFKARATRSEFWFWNLFTTLAGIGAAMVDVAIWTTTDSSVALVGDAWSLAVFLPTIAVAVRRLHDTDRSGWWLFLFFVPLIGGIVLIVWFCFKGTPRYNWFGPNPLPAELSLHSAGRSLLREQKDKAGGAAPPRAEN